MRCERCLRDLPEPYHEYCTVKDRKELPIVKGALDDGYVAPTVQGKLKHQLAKPGAKPPRRAYLGLDVVLNKPWPNHKEDVQDRGIGVKPGRNPVGIRNWTRKKSPTC